MRDPHRRHDSVSNADFRLRRPRTVCVVGLGYIGLPTASVLADHGCLVYGVDVRQDVIDTVNRGEIHIHEPQLAKLVRKVVAAGSLRAVAQPREADVFVICVPTPISGDHLPDLSFVRQAARAIRPFVRAGSTIILESTSPPGTTENIICPEAVPPGLTVGQDVFVAYCPERVLPGRILIELIENDRLVGGITPACSRFIQEFYEEFVQGQVHTTDAVSAETAKLAENAFRDVNIAFANELSVLARQIGADPWEVIRLANRHPRVNILNPGPGVGGHCISVDPWFLVHAAPTCSQLIRTAREVNDEKPDHVVKQIIELVRRHRVQTVGCLGLTYKADVDDLRESPSLRIVQDLHRHDVGKILVCDPHVASEQFAEFSFYPLDQVIQRSELLVLLTDHQQFREIPAGRLLGKHLVDTRGCWNSVLTGTAHGETKRAA